MTIIPNYDATARAIASHLKTCLNAEAINYPYLGGKAVEGCNDGNTYNNAQDKLPLLMVYRLRGDKEQHDFQVEYFLPIYNDHYKQSGILNWARYHIMKCLDCCQADCYRVVGSMSYRLLFAQPDRKIHPLAIVNFSVMEHF